jgi:hypothetical protein
MKRFRYICVIFVLAAGLYAVSGCLYIGASGDETEAGVEASEEDEEVRTDIEFTVCEEGRLPKELVEIIESKKAQPFRLTFTTRDYMYIVVGYGAQQRGGCAVTVNQLYRTEQAVHIDTNLVGVEGETIKIDGMTYPYVAVRCENQNLPVVYE